MKRKVTGSAIDLRERVFMSVLISYSNSKFFQLIYASLLSLALSLILDISPLISIIIPIFTFIVWRDIITKDFAMLVLYWKCCLGLRCWSYKLNDSISFGAIPLRIKGRINIESCKADVVLYLSDGSERNGNSKYFVGNIITDDEWRNSGIQVHNINDSKIGYQLNWLAEGAAIIDRCVSNGKRIYVSDFHGCDRCFLVIMAYLMKYEQLRLHESYIRVKLCLEDGIIFNEASEPFKCVAKYEKLLRS